MPKPTKSCQSCIDHLKDKGVPEPLAEDLSVTAYHLLGEEPYECGGLTPTECKNVKAGLRPCGKPWGKARKKR